MPLRELVEKVGLLSFTVCSPSFPLPEISRHVSTGSVSLYESESAANHITFPGWLFAPVGFPTPPGPLCEYMTTGAMRANIMNNFFIKTCFLIHVKYISIFFNSFTKISTTNITNDKNYKNKDKPLFFLSKWHILYTYYFFHLFATSKDTNLIPHNK